MTDFTRQQVHGAVRQIMLNELGLNRGQIKKEIAEELQRQIKTYFRQLDEEGRLIQILEAIIARLCKDRWTANYRRELKDAMDDAIKKVSYQYAERAMDGKVKIEIG